jgi:hypothetical protein
MVAALVRPARPTPAPVVIGPIAVRCVRMTRFHRRSGLSLLLALVMVACSSPADGGPGVADRIRAAGDPAVERVEYEAPSGDEPGEVKVFLREGTTGDEADEFWCAVVVPAGGSNRRDPGTYPVTVWNTDETSQLAQDADCEDQPV